MLNKAKSHYSALLLLLSCLLPFNLSAAPPVYEADILDTLSSPLARQGIAVDAGHVYVIDNRRLGKYDKATWNPLALWNEGESLVHMDSGVVIDGELFVAHSNYPGWPMTGSVEVWDPATLEHARSIPLENVPGSLTWLDYDGQAWWGAFGNYDSVQDGMDVPYGETDNTVIVRFDDDFKVVQQWRLPGELLDRLRPMSNSGGSWGPDGLLYLSGHDRGEIYAMQVPASGSELEWVATVTVPDYEGQGIAWDRTGSGRILWAIRRAGGRVYRIAIPDIIGPE